MWGLIVVLLAFAAPAFAQAPCTHYASPTGGGNGLSESSPFRISNFWSVAGPGKTLCLLDGTYTGGSSLIEPPTTLRGTQAQPITIRAINEGRVLLDGQGAWAIRLRGVEWFVVEGLNARNGSEFLISVSGAHNRLRRVIGWDGQSGQSDSNIFRVYGQDNIIEDCAGWGMNSRKIFDGAQAGNVGQSGFRRCWGEWNDHPDGQSWPNNTFQGGYNTTNQLFENIIGTWDTVGTSKEVEGVVRFFKGAPEQSNDIGGSRVLGSIFYVAPGTRYDPDTVFTTDGISNLLMQDVVAYVAPGYSGVEPFSFTNQGCSSGDPCTGNVCANCLAVHAGNASTRAGGFSTPNWREGNGLAAATGGQSAFNLLPGICRRYANGVLTDQPLWPWPMDQRIWDARLASGREPVNVTQAIEEILGPIPEVCRGVSEPDPDPEPAPVSDPVAVSLQHTSVAPGGSVRVHWHNIPEPSPTDWIGLYRVGASHQSYLAWRYTDGQFAGSVPFVIPASIPPGTYEVRLYSDDVFIWLATAPELLTVQAMCSCPCNP